MKKSSPAPACLPDDLYFIGTPCDWELHFTVSCPPDAETIRMLQALMIPSDEGTIFLRDQPDERHPVIDPAVGKMMIYFIGRETGWDRVFQRLGWKNTSANKRRLERAILAGNRCRIQIRGKDELGDGHIEQLIPDFSTSSCDGNMFEIIFSIRTNLFEFLFENPDPNLRGAELVTVRPQPAGPLPTPPKP
jgi:hypothetical protein